MLYRNCSIISFLVTTIFQYYLMYLLCTFLDQLPNTTKSIMHKVNSQVENVEKLVGSPPKRNEIADFKQVMYYN